MTCIKPVPSDEEEQAHIGSKFQSLDFHSPLLLSCDCIAFTLRSTVLSPSTQTPCICIIEPMCSSALSPYSPVCSFSLVVMHSSAPRISSVSHMHIYIGAPTITFIAHTPGAYRTQRSSVHLSYSCMLSPVHAHLHYCEHSSH